MCYILDQIENRGINKGRLEGRQEGKEEGRQEIILKMLKNDFTDEQIKACTDVTYQELEKIKEKVACAVTEQQNSRRGGESVTLLTQLLTSPSLV